MIIGWEILKFYVAPLIQWSMLEVTHAFISVIYRTILGDSLQCSQFIGAHSMLCELLNGNSYDKLIVVLPCRELCPVNLYTL